jgi:hypothetical protein
LALAFLGLVSKDRVAGIDAACPRDHAGPEQHRLGERGLAVALMPDERNVAYRRFGAVVRGDDSGLSV